MCGIVVALTPRQPTSVATVQAMCDTLRHRGPDDEGYLVVRADLALPLGGPDTPAEVHATPTPFQPRGRADATPQQAGELVLGHRRLAIVDLSPLGHQPMRRERLWCVYNGEIYNHVELRAELEALGHRFESHSDTEVLLAAWTQWGPQALERCNGMWAIAIVDLDRRRLTVARDRFGVKPLYVWQGSDGALLFASEIKALLVHPAVRAAASAPECAAFVVHGPQAWREETEFDGIRRFPAGHWAEVPIDAPGPLAPQPYWSYPELQAGADEHAFDAARAAQLQARYAELLADAVALRMRADVRIGTALSGGLDSSSIALLVNEQLRRQGVSERQEVFSSVYTDPRHRDVDESAYIERVAHRLDVRSNRIEPQAADVPAAHERMVWALDTPAPNTLMSSWHTFRLVAARGVTVTLDGQGADEQLAGYARYVRNRLVHQSPAAAWREARAVAGGMQGFGSHVRVGLGGMLLRRLAGPATLEALVRRLRMGSNPALTLDAALRHDFLGNLKNLLLYADKTAMAWSVESRMPFMDYRLVEFLCRVEPAYKIHAGWTKWLGRAALADRLPAEVTWRRDKLGWPIPERAWFGGPLRDWQARTLGASRFAREVAAAAGWREPARAPFEVQLRLLNLAVWHRLYFEEPDRPGRALGRAMAEPAGAPA
jgi:asparagine synthase (glutamine-hydrolysing)